MIWESPFIIGFIDIQIFDNPDSLLYGRFCPDPQSSDNQGSTVLSKYSTTHLP